MAPPNASAMNRKPQRDRNSFGQKVLCAEREKCDLPNDPSGGEQARNLEPEYGPSTVTGLGMQWL